MPVERLEPEFQEVLRKIELLKQSEGFDKLSLKQQQILFSAPFIETRATLKEKGVSAELKLIWYCHAVVYAVEHEISLSPEGLRQIHDTAGIHLKFAEADYFEKPVSVTEIRKHLETIPLPCIMVASNTLSDGKTSIPVARHSFIVFKNANSGELIAWEKEGPNLPFKIGPIEDVYEKYVNSDYMWGTRPLIKEPLQS